MKSIEKDIYDFQENDFFFPIRSKSNYVKVIALAARQLLLDLGPSQVPCNAKMKLVVDKMSRIFFFKTGKFFSIAFPFSANIIDNEVKELTSYSGKILDSKSISAIISILDSEEFKANLSLIDFYIEPNSIESDGIFLLEEMLMFEPSYIRYDVDAENQNGKLHPLNHLDVNYSQYSTFKLGLNNGINEMYFENIQDIKTDCLFLVE
jgi:hypothetical protein